MENIYFANKHNQTETILNIFRTWHKYFVRMLAYAKRYFAPEEWVIRLSHPWTFQLPLKWAYNSIPVVTFTWNCIGLYSGKKNQLPTLLTFILHRLRAFFCETIQLSRNNSAVLCIHLIHRTQSIYVLTTNKQ